jgi:hypothetical protein
MASVFGNQWEYGKALRWYQRALNGRQKKLSENRPLTRRTASNMASVRDRENVSYRCDTIK